MKPPTSTPVSTSSSPSSSFLQNLLNRTLRIKLADTRTFIGQFICVDRQQNIILSNAEEFLSPELERKRGAPVSRGYFGGREMGMVMFRGKDVVRIEVEDGDGVELEMNGKGGIRMDVI
jgi:small nuclear ribonucleoprotein (snRNP)-like protein